MSRVYLKIGNGSEFWECEYFLTHYRNVSLGFDLANLLDLLALSLLHK